jgi:hybrid cluster-associated redox disulfide protein
MIELTKDTLVSDVLRLVPGGAEVFMTMGMHCLHCGSAQGETLEEACLVHGMDLDTLLDELESQIALYE